jgi:hypothetical protein
MGATAGLDGEDAICGERLVLDEKFLVFAGEDVVGYYRYKIRDIRLSWGSLLKCLMEISPMLCILRRIWQRTSVRAVLPDPTGL